MQSVSPNESSSSSRLFKSSVSQRVGRRAAVIVRSLVHMPFETQAAGVSLRDNICVATSWEVGPKMKWVLRRHRLRSAASNAKKKTQKETNKDTNPPKCSKLPQNSPED